MTGSLRVPRAAVLALGSLLLAGSMTPVLAAAPSNDAIASPVVVGSLPFAAASVDTRDATTGPTDPAFCSEASSGQDGHSVWYAFSPSASGRYAADTFGSDYDTTLYVGTSNGAGGIDVIGCNDDTQELQSAVTWQGVAGTTYLIMAASCCGTAFVGPGGSLSLHVALAPPSPQLTFTVASSGSFSRYGVATLRGTLSCANSGGIAIVDLAVTQAVGRKSIFGDGFGELECSSTPAPWSIDVFTEDGKFLGGHVTVEAFSQACGPFECVSDSRTITVNLRH